MTSAIITARMGSSRLPGKIMLTLAGAPLLQRMVERVKRSTLLDDVIVATSSELSDDIVEDMCHSIGCSCFRGSEDDVLDRVLSAAIHFNVEDVVHLTGDCPFIDPALIDETIRYYRDMGLDYAGNNLNATFPIGMDVRMFSLKALKDVASRTQDPIDRAHVTYYIYNHPELYSIGGNDAPAGFPTDLRLTVDEFLDFKLATLVFEHFSDNVSAFTAEDIFQYLAQHPEYAYINQNVRQKAAEEC